ncbi:MAG: Crp/Fnr family transcriptional regulator [Candidatus Saccharibacteria bacterium]|jgi:CRP-like cAMP-binding protein
MNKGYAMQLDKVLRQFPQEVFEKGQAIFRLGEVAKHGYIVLDGIVKIYICDRLGIERRLFSAHRYDMVPSGWLADPSRPMRYHYAAYDRVILARIQPAQFRAILTQVPDALIALLIAQDDRVHHTKLRIETVIQSRAEDKVAYFFEYLSERVADPPDTDGWSKIVVGLSHQEMSDALGLARETTAAAIQSLEKKGYIRKAGRQKYFIHIEGLRHYIDSVRS